MKNRKLLNLLVLVIALFMLSTACAPEQQDVLSETSTPEATTEVTFAPEETQESKIYLTLMDINEAKEPTATDELPPFPAVKDGMDVQFVAADTIMNGLKLETFTVNYEDESNNSCFSYGGKLTVGDDVHPFILSPDMAKPTEYPYHVDYAMVINEEPYKDYFFVQVFSTADSPDYYIYTFSYDSDLPIAIMPGQFKSIGSESVSLFWNVSMFGEWAMEQEYTFTPNESGAFSNCFTPVDDLWTSSVDSDDGIPESSIVVIKEFEAYLKGADGEYTKDTLPAETQLIVTGLQSDNTIYFKTGDGMEGYIDNYDPSAGTIGGVSENELVEMYFDYSDGVPLYLSFSAIITPLTLEDFSSDQIISDEVLEAIRALEEYSK